MINVVLIDDESDAIDNLELLIKEFCPELQIVGKANNVLQGIKEINTKKPDLIFLDIDMPHGTGFDLLESMPERNFDVIFATAFNNYAIKAFRANAIDYILKPVDVDELLSAVEKVLINKKIKSNNDARIENLLQSRNNPKISKIAVTTAEAIIYLNTDEIIRVEADGSYATVFMVNKEKYLISKNVKDFEEMIDSEDFFRAHNSHLINLNHVKKVVKLDGGYIEMADHSQIPVSRRRKDDFTLLMQKYLKNS